MLHGIINARIIRIKLCSLHAALNILACLSKCLGHALSNTHALAFNHPNTSSTINRSAVNSLLKSIITRFVSSFIILSYVFFCIGTARPAPPINPPSAM